VRCFSIYYILIYVITAILQGFSASLKATSGAKKRTHKSSSHAEAYDYPITIEAFEGPEPDDRQVSRPVLRGPGPSNGVRLLGEWFTNLTQQAVYFVTRLKDNADYGVLEKREVPQRRGVPRDEVIFLYKLAQAGQDAYFRRIEFYDEQRDRVLVFLTNHLELAAATVAAIYKERWQIELFFRALKQSLRVKTFLACRNSWRCSWPKPANQLDSSDHPHQKKRVTARFQGEEFRRQQNTSNSSGLPTCPRSGLGPRLLLLFWICPSRVFS